MSVDCESPGIKALPLQLFFEFRYSEKINYLRRNIFIKLGKRMMSSTSTYFATVHLFLPVMIVVSLAALASSIRTMSCHAKLEDRLNALSADVALLDAKPGQIVIFTVPEAVNKSQMEYLRSVLLPLLPDGVKGVLMKSGATYAVTDFPPAVQFQPKE